MGVQPYKYTLNMKKDVTEEKTEFSIELDGSVKCLDEDFGNLYASNLWLDKGRIVVRWVTLEGADCNSLLLDESEEVVWDIIKSIR